MAPHRQYRTLRNGNRLSHHCSFSYACLLPSILPISGYSYVLNLKPAMSCVVFGSKWNHLKVASRRFVTVIRYLLFASECPGRFFRNHNHSLCPEITTRWMSVSLTSRSAPDRQPINRFCNRGTICVAWFEHNCDIVCITVR